MRNKEYIKSVLRALGGQDPDMKDRNKEQIEQDGKNAIDYFERLNKSLAILENE